MNETERLTYLDAMGVISYIPRVVLPGALPSVLCEETVYEAAAGKEVASEVPLAANSLRELQGSLAGKNSTDKRAVSVKPAQAKAATQAVSTSQINVRFHWVIFQPVPEMLLLVPVAHTDRNGLELLKKILSAIGILNIPLSPLENFVWPPVAHNSVQTIAMGNGLNDARETLQAFLEGYQFKQKQQQQALIKNALVFDGNLGKTIFEGMNLPDIQLRILPSLHLMLTSSPEKIAEAKQLTWQRLKDLKDAT